MVSPHGKATWHMEAVEYLVVLIWQRFLVQPTHLAVSGLTVRLPVWPWQQVCVKRVRKWGVRATWIFIMTSPVYWRQRGGHTQVRLFGPPESTVNWPGRRREEGGSEHIAHIRVIQVLPVADNWIDEDEPTWLPDSMVRCRDLTAWWYGLMQGQAVDLVPESPDQGVFTSFVRILYPSLTQSHKKTLKQWRFNVGPAS